MLDYLNVLLIPALVYLIINEKRLSCIKTKVDFLYNIWNKRSK